MNQSKPKLMLFLQHNYVFSKPKIQSLDAHLDKLKWKHQVKNLDIEMQQMKS